MDFGKVKTPLGEMLLMASDRALMGAWFIGQRYFPPVTPARMGAAPLISGKSVPSGKFSLVLVEAAKELERYFDGKDETFSLRLDPEGTPFQQSIWATLRESPYGGTVSYSEVAARAGRPKAVRAAAAAIGHNPLSIFIPCHRVLGKDGGLTGYAGGLDRKKALLSLEKSRHSLLP